LVNWLVSRKYLEQVWQVPVGVTDLQFLDSKRYGEEYENDMFVADVNNGNIYHFDLNDKRTELSVRSDLKDEVADKTADITFGQGFGGITDMQIGSDGYLYVLTINRFHENNAGTIYRTVPVPIST
jgi:aldose sugar dehydrogenase